jgi:phosphatidylglycerophosphatase A
VAGSQWPIAKRVGRGHNMRAMSAEIQNRPREFLRPLIASCFGLGYSPIMPGTCCALLGPLFYVPLALGFPSEPLQSGLIAVNLAFWSVVTVAFGRWAESYYQQKDSQVFGTDEVAGFLLTVLLYHDPERPIVTALWAFPVTRIIDIIKIPPARSLERLPRGWGVLADDLLGSIYAAGVLFLIDYFFAGAGLGLPLRSLAPNIE